MTLRVFARVFADVSSNRNSFDFRARQFKTLKMDMLRSFETSAKTRRHVTALIISVRMERIYVFCMTDTINADDFPKIIKSLACKVGTAPVLGGVGPEFLYIVYFRRRSIVRFIDNQNRVSFCCGPLFRNVMTCKTEFR